MVSYDLKKLILRSAGIVVSAELNLKMREAKLLTAFGAKPTNRYVV